MHAKARMRGTPSSPQPATKTVAIQYLPLSQPLRFVSTVVCETHLHFYFYSRIPITSSSFCSQHCPSRTAALLVVLATHQSHPSTCFAFIQPALASLDCSVAYFRSTWYGRFHSGYTTNENDENPCSFGAIDKAHWSSHP